LFFSSNSNGQIIFTAQLDDLGVNLSFGTLDVATCTYTELNPGPVVGFQDFCIGPNGEIYTSTIAAGLGIYDVATNTNTLILPIPDFLANSMEILPNGLIYAAGQNLWEIDPVAGTFTDLGPLSFAGEGDLAFINGQLYLTGSNGTTSCLVQVDIANPLNSTCVLPLPYFANTGLVNVPSSTCGDQLYATGVTIDPQTSLITSYVYSIDLNNNTVNELCISDAISGYADFAVPFNYDFTGPCCVTDAGSIDQGTIEVCANQTITLPHNDDEVLDNDDLLQFAIASNINNLSGSIITRQNGTVFSFQPNIMNTGTVYYAFALAGNNTNGQVSLTDPCLDLSNAIPILWKPLPSVTFSAPNNSCIDNGCIDVSVLFTGVSVYNLDYTVFSGANAIVTNTFTSNTNANVMTVCLPAGFAGPIQIRATELTDASCTCSN
jgi:hypothetical protein